MIDLISLHPNDNSPAALNAAIVRCSIAGRGALAEIERLKGVRAGLLLQGDAVGLAANLNELTHAMGEATAIGELLDQLQKTRPVDPPVDLPTAIRQAGAQIGAWWQANGIVVLDGVWVLVAAFTAVVTAARAAGAAPPTPPPTNVSPLKRPPP